MNHGDMHPGFAALGAFFIVFAQPSASAQPSQGAFHHPPPGQDLKVVAVRFALDHGQQPTARGPSVPRQLYLPTHYLKSNVTEVRSNRASWRTRPRNPR